MTALARSHRYVGDIFENFTSQRRAIGHQHFIVVYSIFRLRQYSIIGEYGSKQVGAVSFSSLTNKRANFPKVQCIVLELFVEHYIVGVLVYSLSISIVHNCTSCDSILYLYKLNATN